MAKNHFAHDAPSPAAAANEPASLSEPDDILAFDPVPLRYRTDGLTPARQREYVEALADCGVAREAAARIGVSEQAINRVRRRADARAFDLACEAAIRFGARQLRSIAFERAIEGTIKRHYYHGELKSEERVYDNRLLIYLLGRVQHLIERAEDSAAVADQWQPWVEAMEQGAPSPSLAPVEQPGEAGDALLDAAGTDFEGDEIWQDDEGDWWTWFPAPAGFDGAEEGAPGHPDYKRRLSDAERAVIEADKAREQAEQAAWEHARRDAYFGFAGGRAGAQISSPRQAETNETSAADCPGIAPGYSRSRARPDGEAARDLAGAAAHAAAAADSVDNPGSAAPAGIRERRRKPIYTRGHGA